jgi:hypothetical protein
MWKCEEKKDRFEDLGVDGNNINIGLEEIEWRSVDWIELV